MWNGGELVTRDAAADAARGRDGASFLTSAPELMQTLLGKIDALGEFLPAKLTVREIFLQCCASLGSGDVITAIPATALIQMITGLEEMIMHCAADPLSDRVTRSTARPIRNT
jgi:hypothetical protein